MRRLAVMLYVLGKSTVCRKPAARQIRKLTLELLGYLRNNSDSLPNYGRRYRAGRRISKRLCGIRGQPGVIVLSMQFDTVSTKNAL